MRHPPGTIPSRVGLSNDGADGLDQDVGRRVETGTMSEKSFSVANPVPISLDNPRLPTLSMPRAGSARSSKFCHSSFSRNCDSSLAMVCVAVSKRVAFS